MNRQELLDAIVDDGTTEIPLAYPRPDQKSKRDGTIAGFEACRGLDDDALIALMEAASRNTARARDGRHANYWWHRMFEIQVEWTINVLSAAYHAHDLPTLVTPTVRGMNKAASILRGDS